MLAMVIPFVQFKQELVKVSFDCENVSKRQNVSEVHRDGGKKHT